MILAPGSQVGPYQIVAPLGAGGMGEVYRARDPRIGRDVALKVLPPAVVDDAARLRRFEQEARAAGALNHPGLLTIFDVGNAGNLFYIVSELLEGSTLRERMDAPMGPRRAVDYAMQVARGLAVAHEKGIVHRDLKPENIFVTEDERVKVLDFGLAKVLHDGPATINPDMPTERHERLDTAPGEVVGTVSYMSPEQLRGLPVDHRTDVFSFGVMLYEMLAGTRPFRGASQVETMAAILNDDAPRLPDSVTPSLQRIVQHAVEKSASQRFQSMKDVAFALETFSSGTDGVGPVKARAAAKAPRAQKGEATARDVKYRRVSFRRGFVMTARFAPDQSIVYGASWEDCPNEIFAAFPGNPESRRVGDAQGDVLAISPSGEMAVSLNRHFVGGWVTSGTLAVVPLFGGAPRELADDVMDADWTPDGKVLAVSRRADDRFVIEMPLGTPIYESPHWFSHIRVSPKGDAIAFLQHELWGDDGGHVVVIDLAGNLKVQSTRSPSMGGLAWTPNGDEVWFAAHHEDAGRDLLGLSLKGRERVVLPVPGRFTMHDIARDGRVLVAEESGRREIVVGSRGLPRERNVTWLDWSFLGGLAPDGSRVLFEEQAGARINNSNRVYFRGTDGAPAVRLGEGRGRGFTADGRMVGVIPTGGDALHLLPIGVGTRREVPLRGLQGCAFWEFTPDGTRVVVWAHQGELGSRHFELDLEGDAPPRPVSPAGTGWWFAVSPDSSSIAAVLPDQHVAVIPLAGGAPRRVAGCEPGDLPVQWSGDGSSIFVFKPGRVAVSVDRVDLASGARTPWQELRHADPAGVMDIMPICMTRDGSHYAYGFRRFISDLYIIDGLT